MALENYIINASNTATDGYHNAMAGYDQRNRESKADAQLARNNMVQDRGYRDSKLRETLEMAAMAYREDDEEAAFGLMDQVGVGEFGLQPVNRDQIRPVLQQLRGQLGAGNAYGSVVYGEDDLGNAVVMQPTKDGRLVRSPLPEGVSRVTLPTRSVDLGDQVIQVPTRGNGGPVNTYEKGIAPQDQPAFRAAQAGAVTGAQEDAQIAAIPRRTQQEILSAFDKAKAVGVQEAQKELPKLIDQTTQSIAVIDQLVNHEGLDYIIGAYSYAPIVRGTPQANADSYMKQIEGKAFLEAFATLKGGGQITEVEGRKATEAMLRLSRGQTKAAFVQSMNELRGILQTGLERAQKAATPKDNLSALQQNLGATMSTSVDLPVGTVDGGYEYIGGDPSKPESWKQQ